MKRYKTNQPFSSSKASKSRAKKNISIINPDSAGIDIGSRSHFVAVPEDCDEKNVREFSSTTTGLLEMVNWLKKCSIKTIAMESTGSYWIPAYEILESSGFEVYLVNAQFIKNVPGRKTDVIDCQWIQKLHSFGLLSKSFRPQDHALKLRALARQHTSLIEHRSPHVQHMQKALQEMNVQLHTHIRDITGLTGMRIINAILQGERNPKVFATLVHPSCKNPSEKIANSLRGNYRDEHLFALKQARDLYMFFSEKVVEAEQEIQKALAEFSDYVNFKDNKKQALEVDDSKNDIVFKKLKKLKIEKKENEKKVKKGLSFSADPFLKAITGVDLTTIPGIDQTLGLKIMAEIGGNVDAWKSEKHFASWLGVCPGNKISGGRQISGKTKTCKNRVSIYLRMAANGLWNAKCYLGAYLRRLRNRLGGMKAITATAHKLAKIIYAMIKQGVEYREIGEDFYERTYNQRRLKALQRQAKDMGFELISTN